MNCVTRCSGAHFGRGPMTRSGAWLGRHGESRIFGLRFALARDFSGYARRCSGRRSATASIPAPDSNEAGRPPSSGRPELGLEQQDRKAARRDHCRSRTERCSFSIPRVIRSAGIGWVVRRHLDSIEVLACRCAAIANFCMRQCALLASSQPSVQASCASEQITES